MSYLRLPYDEAATATEMTADCRAVGDALHLPSRPTPAEVAARAAVGPAPSLLFEDFPREVRKPELRISEAASRLARVYDQD